MNVKVNIIIPLYNAENTLPQLLCSIALQKEQNCEVILVNDGQPNKTTTYNCIINNFPMLNIKYICLEQNSGPAMARQIGIENSVAPYIMFCDADDQLYGSTAIEMLLDTIEQQELNIVSANFQRIFDKKIVECGHNKTWLFAKIFRRSFLNKYNISFRNFPAPYSNEDSAFCSLCWLYIQQYEPGTFLYIDNIIYEWHEQEHSLTNEKDSAFLYNRNIQGFLQNHFYINDVASTRIGQATKSIIEDYAQCIYVVYGSLNELFSDEKRAKKTLDEIITICNAKHFTLYNAAKSFYFYCYLQQHLIQSVPYFTIFQLFEWLGFSELQIQSIKDAYARYLKTLVLNN